MLNVKKEELDFLKEVLLSVVNNGNSVNEKAFVPTGNQYKIACRVINKINEQVKL